MRRAFAEIQEEYDLRLVWDAGQEPPHPVPFAEDCDEPEECTCPRGTMRCLRGLAVAA